jgi:YD repeat-containing protein
MSPQTRSAVGLSPFVSAACCSRPEPGSGFPGTAAWVPTLCRNWSHDYAQRIVLDPIAANDTHVWLITSKATFREWSGLSSGVYGTVSPSDEKRTLRRTAGGWELVELDDTVHFFNAGQPLSVDPPGYATSDQTAFTYDPARGNLLPLTRSDPLVGSTTFGYDGLNRRTSTIDPNLVQTLTAYDSLHRVTSVTQKGATAPADLVTTYQYTPFGDLLRTVLPRGNVIEYGYDPAGRMVSIERRPDTSTRGERTLYTLDAYGHRTKEELQHWSGTAWVTDTFTDFVYSTRCHLDKTINADGTATEYAYL